jgi:hypothetical protein
MRLWTIHPKYLDRMGLLGLWREALATQSILLGNKPNSPYRHHPQVKRFSQLARPIPAIVEYLKWIWVEGRARGYKFNQDLAVETTNQFCRFYISEAQLAYEYDLIGDKILSRDMEWYNTAYEHLNFDEIEPHPLYTVDPRTEWQPGVVAIEAAGEIASWERPKPTKHHYGRIKHGQETLEQEGIRTYPPPPGFTVGALG